MSKLVAFALVACALAITASVAISSIVVDHKHDGTTMVNHQAPVDSNGCHIGPSGFHCH